MNKKAVNKPAKLHIKKGDMVQVIAGDSKGKKGRVIKVYPQTNRALVEGLNMVTKHKKPTATNNAGTIEHKEAPIHISNLAVVVNGQISKVGRKVNESGKLQRFARKTGEFI